MSTEPDLQGVIDDPLSPLSFVTKSFPKVVPDFESGDGHWYIFKVDALFLKVPAWLVLGNGIFPKSQLCLVSLGPEQLR